MYLTAETSWLSQFSTECRSTLNMRKNYFLKHHFVFISMQSEMYIALYWNNLEFFFQECINFGEDSGV